MWENLPNGTDVSSGSRTVLNNAFPSDWPDNEYIFNAAGPATTTPGDFISLGVVVLKSTSQGSVGIKSADTADNPLVDTKWFQTKEDQELGIQGLKRVRLFANTTGVLAGPEILPGPAVQTDDQILTFIKSAASPSHHAVGTCKATIQLQFGRSTALTYYFLIVGKMGKASDASAVVDTNGCVLGGVSGLRVVDASIMPLLPPGQPMSTVCKCLGDSGELMAPANVARLDAIAEKLAANILSGRACSGLAATA